MSNFYSNITLVSNQAAEITAVLIASKTTTYVYQENAFVCVFPKSDDLLFPIAKGLSKKLDCVAFAVIVHDDSALQYQLFSSGNFLDEYNSCPGYFTGQGQPPLGGDAQVLADSFELSKAANWLDEILRKSYTFELNRHDAICAKLELPYCTVGGGFKYIVENDAPEDLTADKLTLTYPHGEEDDSDFAFHGTAQFVPGVGIVQNAADWLRHPAAASNGLQDSIAASSYANDKAPAINVPNKSTHEDFDADKLIEEALLRAQAGADAFIKESSMIRVTGSAAGGAVKIHSQGKFQFTKIEIQKEVVDLTDTGSLESLVLTALNDAARQTTDRLAEIKERVNTPKYGIGQIQLP